MFVKDTAKAFLEIANCDKLIGEEVNIATQTEISIGDLAQSIIDVVNPKAKIVSDDVRLRPEKSEVERLMGSNEKLQKFTNWKQEVNLKDGLAKTIEWFKNPHHLSQYKADIYNV